MGAICAALQPGVFPHAGRGGFTCQISFPVARLSATSPPPASGMDCLQSDMAKYARSPGSKNQAAAFRERCQNWRGSEVIVVTVVGRTIDPFLHIGPETGESPAIAGRRLARP